MLSFLNKPTILFINHSKNNNFLRFKSTFYGYTADSSHLVAPSPWPFVSAVNAFALVTSLTTYMHGYRFSFGYLIFSLIFIIGSMSFWWRDVIRESTFEGNHTAKIQLGLRLGMILFIISEVMFFIALFWAFYHSSISPVINLGTVWPPKGIIPLNPFGVPLLNTIILLSSGVFITWCHHAILAGQRTSAIVSLSFTIILAIIFTYCQYFEYINAPFTISDSVYGSCFFITTGFHGFHVFIGTLFLIVCLVRLYNYHFTKEHHFGFEAAAWYWHFVDVVWLFVFITIYWWGN